MKNENQSKILHILDGEGEMENVIRNIADGQENSFFVCNVDRIVRNFKVFKEKLPQIQPFFSVKCNDNVTVLEILAALGSGFNCASKTEINNILSLVGGENIIFGNPAKMASHIRHAANSDVNLMSFDSEVQLHKIKEYHPNAKLLICVRPSDETNDEINDTIKFGCDPINEAPNLLLIAKSLGMEVVGVSVHFENDTTVEAKVFQGAIAVVREIFDLATTLGFNFNRLDFGDGFPTEVGTNFDKIAETINSSLNTHFPQYNLTITANPSRFLITSAFTLTCSVNFIRPIPHNHQHFMYFINDGVYGSFGKVSINNETPLKVKTFKDIDNTTENLYMSSIWGPVFDDLDNVVQEIVLPKLEIGDLICFEDMGAYTLSMMGGFNGFTTRKVFVVATVAIWSHLKSLLPELEERLENESSSQKFDAVSPQQQDFSLPTLPITMKLPRFCDGSLIMEEHVLDFVIDCNDVE